MDPDAASRDHRRQVDELLDALGRVPAFARDRHLFVVASNRAARALSPAFRPGANLATFVFLGDVGDCALAEGLQVEVVALLCDSLAQHDDDRRFRALVGELEAKSATFATLWAAQQGPPAHHGAITESRTRALRFHEVRVVNDYELTVVVLSSRR
jgi:hypothetical protein